MELELRLLSGHAELHLAGEVDPVGRPRLDAALATAGRLCDVVLVDLGDVAFMDGCLVREHEELTARGGRLAATSASADARLPIRLLGLEDR